MKDFIKIYWPLFALAIGYWAFVAGAALVFKP